MSHFSAAFRNKETRNVLSACDEMKGPKDLSNGAMASGQSEGLTTGMRSMRLPTGTCVSVWRVRRWARMFRMASCFATGPEILLWWVGSLTRTPTTRPALLVGALTARLRWTPLVRFEAPLGLFPPWDVTFFSVSCSSWGCASAL